MTNKNEGEGGVGTQGRGDSVVVGELSDEQSADDNQRVQLFQQRDCRRLDISEPHTPMGN
ncbi:MAG: hypothetical protein WDM77_04485 [Steroidobacteraceae bacterium]